MASNAPATIQAVIDAYKGSDATAVLEQFDEDAEIVGTQEGERWRGKSDRSSKRGRQVHEELAADFDEFTVDGDLANNVDASEFKYPTKEIAIFHRTASVTAERKKGKKEKETADGRWTAVLQEAGPEDWKIVHSHFSLSEGGKTPKKDKE